MDEKGMAEGFEAFQRVLVRDRNNGKWMADFYSHYDPSLPNRQFHVTVGGYWSQCIPFAGNERLIGTNGGPKLEEPEFVFGEHVEVRDDDAGWQSAVFMGMDKENEGFYLAVVEKDEEHVWSWPQCRKADW